jgi:tetratricopeptide (TPR) repeat protein
MKRNTVALTLIGLCLIIGLVAAVTLLSPSTTADADAVSAANQLYTVGHHAEAAKILEQLVAQGVQDSVVFYNLGNAYYQQDDLGRAILNYQRAARLAPRDGDIKANLQLAREQAVGLFPDDATGPVNSLSNITRNWLTLNETAVVALSLWFTLGFLLLVWRQLQPGTVQTGTKYALIVAAALLALTGLLLGSRLYTENAQPDGVVVADAVAVSSEPGELRTTEFSLHSGTEVNIVETNGDWIRLEMPNGAAQSWIPREAVEMIAANSQRS